MISLIFTVVLVCVCAGALIVAWIGEIEDRFYGLRVSAPDSAESFLRFVAGRGGCSDEVDHMTKSNQDEANELELQLQELQKRRQWTVDSMQSVRVAYATNANPRLSREMEQLKRDYDALTEDIEATLLQIAECEEADWSPW